MFRNFPSRCACLAAVAAIVALPAFASASGSIVAPTRLLLASTHTSTYVTITNTSPEPQRYSVSAYRWDQTPTDHLALGETNEVVYFPGSFTLAPSQSQRVRIGTTAALSQLEKTFRLVVSELPPIDTILQAKTGVGFVANFSIPIYLTPLKPEAVGEITGVTVDRNHLRFVVRNTGNVHLVVKTVRVSAQSASATSVSSDDAAWLVLANRQREVVLPLPPGGCASIKTLAIAVDAGNAKIDRTVAPEHACS